MAPSQRRDGSKRRHRLYDTVGRMYRNVTPTQRDLTPQQQHCIWIATELKRQLRERARNPVAWITSTLSPRTSRTRLAYLFAASSLLVYIQTTAAQTGGGTSGAESVMCGYGLGQLITLAFTLFSLLFVYKGGVQVMKGLDKHKSPDEQEHRQGAQQLEGSLTTFGAAFVPAILMALMEFLGISTISCLDLGTGILGGG